MSEYLYFDHEAKKFKMLFSDEAYSKEELLNFVKQLEEKENGVSLTSVPHPDGNELNPDSLEEIEIETEKPEGFELRDRRSDKSKKAADWTPSDALYAAAQAIKKHHACTEMIIIWWETLPDGKQKFHWRNATSSAAQVSHLLVNMLLDKGHF